ncbi:protein NDR1-like [Salvia hispanica]|uniref:protein NDR1-like n=1 Tax=Salvia hispanica TaxID=49212 RepID=UPI0020099132|nr:protein NDR1-like [Salvia hispanica]
MTDSGAGGGCCRCCCSFIITSGLTALFMWLSLRTSNPTLSIESLYAAALNASDTSPAARGNRTVFLDVKLANGMKDKGVHYANTTLTLSFYRRNSSSSFSDDTDLIAVGDYAWPGFYQGHKKSARRRALVGAAGVPWAEARDAISAGGEGVGFRVRVATRVKFKIMFWYTKRERLEVAGDVQVDATGGKVGKKGVKLKSAAAEVRRGWVAVVIFGLYVVLLC